MLTGENGILTKANKAQTETVNKGALEKVQLAIAGSFDNTGKTNDGLLKDNLGKVEGMETTIPNTITYPLTVKVDGVELKITKENEYAKVEELTNKILITFSIEDEYSGPGYISKKTFQSEKGMPWEEWVNSEYNINQYGEGYTKWEIGYGNRINLKDPTNLYVFIKEVSYQDIIKENHQYITRLENT